MASSPSRAGPVAPSSAATSGRGLGHAVGVSPGGGRRHGRAHGWLLFLSVLMGFRDACCFREFSQPFRTLPRAALASERFYMRAGSTGRAVLRLCALFWFATAMNRCRLLNVSEGLLSFTRFAVWISSAAGTPRHWYAEAVPRVSQCNRAACARLFGTGCGFLFG